MFLRVFCLCRKMWIRKLCWSNLRSWRRKLKKVTCRNGETWFATTVSSYCSSFCLGWIIPGCVSPWAYGVDIHVFLPVICVAFKFMHKFKVDMLRLYSFYACLISVHWRRVKLCVVWSNHFEMNMMCALHWIVGYVWGNISYSSSSVKRYDWKKRTLFYRTIPVIFWCGLYVVN